MGGSSAATPTAVAAQKSRSSRARPAAGRTSARGRSRSVRKAAAADLHTQSEDLPWTINLNDHPKRADSPAYRKARALMMKIAPQKGWYYGAGPYQDHHGAALWVKDEEGWFMLKNLAGIEWSAQFCADPKKVDALRLNAKRLYAKFPLTAAAFKKMGFDLDKLLNTEITDAAGVARWTDSVCNAAIPLGAPVHTGVLTSARAEAIAQLAAGPAKATAKPAARPKSAVAAGGVHHYPTPITDIQFFKRDDFNLWVTDQEGQVAAVVPTAQPDGTAEVVYATPGTQLHRQWLTQHDAGKRLFLSPQHPMAQMSMLAKRPGAV